MEQTGRRFIPAAGHDWTLPLYDPLVALLGGGRARTALVDSAELRPGGAVLDLGCGTGSLAVLIKRRHPALAVSALDPDPKALARATRKVARAGVQVRLDRGFGDALPYPDASFDHVFSSFVYHHLDRGEKQAMLVEARRVLKPGGGLHLLDFGGPEAASLSVVARWLHTSPVLAQNDPAQVLSAMRQAGLAGATRTGGGVLAFGLAGYSCFVGTAPPAEPNEGADRATLPRP